MKQYEKLELKGYSLLPENVISDLEFLLEPECKHENLKLISSSKLSNETTVYNDYRCLDCDEIVKEILP
jgi:hypothetical protein